MGLDFSHCDAHWSYSGFANFRCKLWTSCGFSGNLYSLYEGEQILKQIKKDHPLFDLFNHSDCDGILTPDQLKKIAPALEKIIQAWEDGYNKQQGERLVEGMKLAIQKNENLHFH